MLVKLMHLKIMEYALYVKQQYKIVIPVKIHIYVQDVKMDLLCRRILKDALTVQLKSMDVKIVLQKLTVQFVKMILL